MAQVELPPFVPPTGGNALVQEHRSIQFQASKNSFLEKSLRKLALPKEGVAIGFYDAGKNLPLEKFHFCLADQDTF